MKHGAKVTLICQTAKIGVGCLLDIGYSLDCLILLFELWALDNLWIAYDDTAWVKVIVESLALTKELWREGEG